MSALREQASSIAAALLARVPRGADACATVLWRADGQQRKTVDTAFMGALLLRATAQGTPSAALAQWRDELACILRAQKSAQGSWKYWIRDSAIAQERPCPDDLDTTVCATTALARHSGVLPPEHVANIVRLLTSLETSPGGPYRTWLTSPENTKWADVDPVVNAHVGWFLREQEVTLPRLRAWATGIADSARVSPYYGSRLAFLYAIAHWYDGPAQDRVRNELRTILRAETVSPMTVAMAVTALCRLGEPLDALLPYVPRIAAPAEDALLQPYWIDGVWGGVPTFAGSEVLTLALCYEALCTLATAEDAQIAVASDKAFALEVEEVLDYVQTWSAALPSPLAAQARETLATMLARDTQHRRTLIPWLLARAATGVAWNARIAKVCAANALGWLAYTLYDDVLDGDADATVLGLANAAARQAVAWCDGLHAIFDRMDAANTWEVLQCALAKRDDGWRVPAQLPVFTDEKLWERSLGAAYLPTVCTNSGATLQEVQCALIAARQLSDDAHDWEQDLLRGRLNSISVEVLRRAGVQADVLIDAAMLARLRQVFWDDVLDDVVIRAEHFAEHAKRCFASAYPQGDKDFVSKLATRAVQGMQKAQAVREETRAFLDAYISPV